MKNGAKGKKKGLCLNIDSWKIETWTDANHEIVETEKVLTQILNNSVFCSLLVTFVNCRQGDMVTIVIYWLLIVLILLDRSVLCVSSGP